MISIRHSKPEGTLSQPLTICSPIALVFLCCLLVLTPTLLHAQSNNTAFANGNEYRLAAGDVLRISVFGEPDLSVEQVRLNEAGSFSYPFLGDVSAAGLTAQQLEGRIHDGLLGDFLINPRVTVSVLEYRQFFINGEVSRPGAYGWEPGLNLRRAVTIAGGFTERASRRRIDLVREGTDESDGVRIDLDHSISPGDTITIGTGLF